jgi:hypothetical protein
VRRCVGDSGVSEGSVLTLRCFGRKGRLKASVVGMGWMLIEWEWFFRIRGEKGVSINLGFFVLSFRLCICGAG